MCPSSHAFKVCGTWRTCLLAICCVALHPPAFLLFMTIFCLLTIYRRSYEPRVGNFEDKKVTEIACFELSVSRYTEILACTQIYVASVWNSCARFVLNTTRNAEQKSHGLVSIRFALLGLKGTTLCLFAPTICTGPHVYLPLCESPHSWP